MRRGWPSILVDLVLTSARLSPEVLFAGYTVPHPSERKVHVCVQTAGESRIARKASRGLRARKLTLASRECADTTTPAAAFKDAARRLAELCKSTKAHFKTKMAEYDNTMRD